MPSTTSFFYEKSFTATDDAPFIVEEDISVVLVSGNIHCYTNDAYYGNAGTLAAIVRANSVVWFDNLRPGDMVFQNVTAGSNAKIVIAGTQRVK
jgi:hypothetical protein